MIESEMLLNSAAGLLLVGLVWRHPAARAWLGRRTPALMAAGTLIPLLDLVVLLPLVVDRLELLSRPPLFRSPAVAAALIAALAWLTSQWRDLAAARRVALGLAGGYALHTAMALLTPAGVPLLAPWSAARVSLPVFPVGHPPLLVLLGAALLVQGRVSRRFPWGRNLALGLTGLYLVAGTGQFAVVSLRAAGLGGEGAAVHVYPDGNWLLGWQVVEERDASYRFRRHRVLDADFGPGVVQARWNDQARFLTLLGDPVVTRFYYRVFRHPVARVDASGGQVTLLIQELEDLHPRVPGRTFSLERDLDGQNRLYQLLRFY